MMTRRTRKTAPKRVMGVFATLDRAHLRQNPVQGPALPAHRASLQAQLSEALGPCSPELLSLVLKAMS